MTGHAMVRPVLVDVASGDTSAALITALDHGVDLVLANKVPLASSFAISRRILGTRDKGRRVLHEATVGAGLPVIDTLQQLVASGDRVEAIDCSPSGTMGFVFSELGRGRAFSEIVKQAMSLGYTEPDPRDDLSGIDVARKGLILGRMLGYSGEMKDVEIESLIPEALRDVSRDEFLAALPDSDAHRGQRPSKMRGRMARRSATAFASRGAVCARVSPVFRSEALSRRSTALTIFSSS